MKFSALISGVEWQKIDPLSLCEASSESDIQISPRDICTFYFIEFAQHYLDTDDTFESVSSDYLQKLKDKYIIVFGNLIQAQIQKYVNRGRVDSGVSLDKAKKITPMEKRIPALVELMAQTYRSDMQRRNTRWDELGQLLIELTKAKTNRAIITWIDRINNAVHNTKTQILDKLPNRYELLDAFNTAHKAESPKEYLRNINTEILSASNYTSSWSTYKP